MSKEKNNKNKQKEQKLSAVERRRLQRERERNNSGEESRFSAFETIPSKNKRERLSPTDQSRFSNFDVNAEEEKDFLRPTKAVFPTLTLMPKRKKTTISTDFMAVSQARP